MTAMIKSTVTAQHPGEYVRETILKPQNITVTKAADVLGVGRPALSNFLNGKASLSTDMAARIARAFGIPTQKLHDLQAAYDAARTTGTPANSNIYVPPFLSIVANEIEAWSSSLNARSRLSVLLRTLVHSTGIKLTQVDFPGNDDSQRSGWDGFVIANEGTPWIPEGQSGWEFGCDKEPKGKADDDYKKSTKATVKADRSQTVFVFVTPRRWPGKKKWASDRKKEGQWKDVQAYDASDLEQWLEQSVASQTWFANETQRPASNTRSLDQCWIDWAQAANPPLTGGLFKKTVDETRETIEAKLSKPPEEPIIIAADSIEEAVAFLSQLFDETAENLAGFRDRVVIFDKPGALPKIATGSSNFIVVATTREVEREFGPFCRSLYTIVVYPRNAINVEPHVLLEPLNYETFHTALEEAGYDRDEVNRLDNESGRSLTVLRRRLSVIPAVRTPAWADSRETDTYLIPFMFASAWNSSNHCDQAILSFLAKDTPYEVLEKRLQQLTLFNDAPVWSVGTYRGVVSKIDSLFAISGTITRSELDTYFEVAELVLSEDDPTLDLPKEVRLFASLYGKTREISGTLRKGICETLVLLAVHGNAQFQQRLGINVEGKAAQLVSKLLGDPLTTRTLEAHDRDLPTYAEAAPDEFLKILEKDLKLPEPASCGLMRPANAGLFSGCPRTGLLWALENLAWSPTTFTRSVLILARLAEIKIDDNWANKPISSLKSIFRAWLPQTAANVDERIAAMELLVKRSPRVAWEVCIAQFGQSDRIGNYNCKPRWRADAYGYGNSVTNAVWHTFVVKMVNMALSWQSYDRSMLSDLIERLHDIDDAWQETIWNLVKDWAVTASDPDKAWVREKIRTTIMSRRGAARNKERGSNRLENSAKAARAALEPTDIMSRHEWLFRDTWVQESYNEIHDQDLDHEKRAERITIMRAEALQELMTKYGIEGVLRFAEIGKAPFQIGAIMVAKILSPSAIENFILTIAQSAEKTESWTYKNLVMGVLWSIDDDSARTDLLCKIRKHLSPERFVKLLEQAPFGNATWSLVMDMDEMFQKAYWQEVTPSWGDQNDEELNELVNQLLAVKRPCAAFYNVHYKFEKLRPTVLFRLMEEIVMGGEEPKGHYKLDPYDIERAFKILDDSDSFSIEQMAGLEFTYLDVLTQSSTGGGIPNLESYVSDHPEFFAQAVAWVYVRKDGGEDPEELRLSDSTLLHNRAKRGYQLIEGLKNIPGRNQQGDVEADLLLSWTDTVRQLCAELGRQDVGDLSLGKFFAEAPKDDEGIWPCEPVRYVLEQIQSEKISDGITIGLFNARGAHWRGEDGDQERQLAAMYGQWASALKFSSPFVATTILMRMAKRYERDAQDEDSEAKIRRRLG